MITSPSLLTKGQPIGVPGLLQMTGVLWNLRGEAGKREVEDAQTDLTYFRAAWIMGHTTAFILNILKK